MRSSLAAHSGDCGLTRLQAFWSKSQAVLTTSELALPALDNGECSTSYSHVNCHRISTRWRHPHSPASAAATHHKPNDTCNLQLCKMHKGTVVVLRAQQGSAFSVNAAAQSPQSAAFQPGACWLHTRSFAAQSVPPPRQAGNSDDWDWDWLLGAKRSRNPAIKKPQRHQWHFCNPSYDPRQPIPKRITVPFAPPPAAVTDDWQLYKRMRPPLSAGADAIRAFRRQFVRHLKQRDVDWRDSFYLGVAEHAKQLKKRQAKADEASRQAAWREFKEQLFAEAAAAPGKQAVVAGRGMPTGVAATKKVQ